MFSTVCLWTFYVAGCDYDNPTGIRKGTVEQRVTRSVFVVPTSLTSNFGSFGSNTVSLSFFALFDHLSFTVHHSYSQSLYNL